MNIENLNTLIDAIRAEEIATFDLSRWVGEKIDCDTGTVCGTVACIAGFASILNKNFVRVGDLYRHTEQVELYVPLKDVAKYYLGLTTEQAAALFLPDIDECYTDVSARQAIMVLEHFRDTGNIDWSVAGITVSTDTKIRDFAYEFLS